MGPLRGWSGVFNFYVYIGEEKARGGKAFVPEVSQSLPKPSRSSPKPSRSFPKSSQCPPKPIWRQDAHILRRDAPIWRQDASIWHQDAPIWRQDERGACISSQLSALTLSGHVEKSTILFAPPICLCHASQKQTTARHLRLNTNSPPPSFFIILPPLGWLGQQKQKKVKNYLPLRGSLSTRLKKRRFHEMSLWLESLIGLQKSLQKWRLFHTLEIRRRY